MKKKSPKKKIAKKETKTPPGGWLWIIRSCDHRMRAWGNFKWPSKGIVEPKSWRADHDCGRGLHGVTQAQIAAGSSDHRQNIRTRWNKDCVRYTEVGFYLVCRVPKRRVRSIDTDKVKFPWCEVIAKFPAKFPETAKAFLKENQEAEDRGK